MRKLAIPESVMTIKDFIINEVDTLLLCPKFTDYSFLKKIKMYQTGIICAYSSEMEAIKAIDVVDNIWPLELYPDFDIESVETGITKLKLKLKSLTGKNIKAFRNEYEIPQEEDGAYMFTNLRPGSLNKIIFDISGETKEALFYTKTPFINFWCDDSDIPTPYICGFKYDHCNLDYYQQDDPDRPEEVGLRVIVKNGYLNQMDIFGDGFLFGQIFDGTRFGHFPANADGSIFVNNIHPGWKYEILPYSVYNGEKFYNDSAIYSMTVQTLTPELSMGEITKTQRTVTFRNIHATVDESVPKSVCGVTVYRSEIREREFIEADNNGNVTVSDLLPGDEVSYCAAINYMGAAIYQDLAGTVRLENLDIDLTVGPLNPTSAVIRGIYDNNEELNITKEEIRLNTGETAAESKMKATGLEPGTNYNATLTLYTDTKWVENVVLCQKSVNFTTPAISLTTLPAVATSNTCAIIAAETNISDIETGCGFEWRRYDAPDLVPSTFSPSFVANGRLAGKLENLSPSTYYKYRPYYKSSKGVYYYGEWLAFGTADAYVYFEPVVYTFDYEFDGTSVILRGHAIPGSDDIVSQGFEYWPNYGSRAGNDISTIETQGQNMSATINGLNPNTTYSYRAYVRTNKGTTYGTTEQFTTPAYSGISDNPVYDSELNISVSQADEKILISANEDDSESVIYYRLYDTSGHMLANGNIPADGHKHSIMDCQPTPGIYIIIATARNKSKSVKFIVR